MEITGVPRRLVKSILALSDCPGRPWVVVPIVVWVDLVLG